MGERSLHNPALAARTHDLFREVNDRVHDINPEFEEFAAFSDWVCECANRECRERILLTTEEYEQVRAKPITFAVAPTDDHVFEQIDDVVARNDRYWTVQTKGEAGAKVRSDHDADEIRRQGAPAAKRTARRRSASGSPSRISADPLRR